MPNDAKRSLITNALQIASQFPHFGSQSHCPSNKKCVASQVTSKNHKRSIWISFPGTSARKEKQLTSKSCWRTPFYQRMRWNSWKTAILPTSWILAMVNLYSLLRLTCGWLRSFCWLCSGGCTRTTRCLVKGKSQIDTIKAPECYKWMQVPLVAVCKLVYLNIPYICTYICTMYVCILCARYIHTWIMAISYTNVYIYTRFNYALSVTWPEVK